MRYRASDRRVFVAACILHHKWFERLYWITGAPELLEDPRFANPRVQAKHTDELITAIEVKLARRPAAEWEAELVAAGLPASVVRTLAEVLSDPHVQQRGILSEVDLPEPGKTATVVGAGFSFDHDQPRFQGPVPRLGEHSQQVLADRGRGRASGSGRRSDGV